jgi:hypothetical protein
MTIKTILLACSAMAWSGTIQPSDPVVVGAATVLATALQDQRLVLKQSETFFLQNNPLYLPWLDELEFRFGPDDLYVSEQRAAIRFSANGFRQIKRQKAIHNLEVDITKAERRALLQESLMERYSTLCDLYFLPQLIAAHEQLAQMYDTTRQAYSYLLAAGAKVDVVDIIDAEEDGYDTHDKLMELRGENAEALQLLKRWMNASGDVDLQFNAFIGPEQMAQIAASLLAGTQSVSPELAIKTLDVQLEQAQWRLEKARQFDIFNFFQIDYQRPVEPFQLQRDFSARIGLNVPIPGSRRVNQREQALAVHQAENDLQWTAIAQRQLLEQQALKLNNLIEQQRSLLADNQKSPVQRLLDSPVALTNLEAVDILRLRLIKQKQVINQIEIAYEVAQCYVDLLYVSGAAGAEPLRNYLSPSLDTL